jgi:hypothetical protein
MNKPTKDDLINILQKQAQAMDFFNSLCSSEKYSSLANELLETRLIYGPETAQEKIIYLCADYILEHWEE